MMNRINFQFLINHKSLMFLYNVRIIYFLNKSINNQISKREKFILNYK